MNKISVIIPTYKPQGYLRECLISLDKQTLSHHLFEVILVLNGCKDPYYSEIVSLQKQLQDLHIQIFYTDETGVSNARNIGLDAATGEYITFIDDDDYVSESYLEDLLIASSESVVGIARPVAFTENVNKSQPYILNSLFDKLFPSENISFLKCRRFFSGPCFKLYHHSTIGNRRFNTHFTVGEDGLFNFLISDRFNKCTLANPRAVYFRRYRVGSLVYKRQNKLYLTMNNMKLLCEIQRIYLSSPRAYSFWFYFMQSLSCIKGIFCK